MADHAEPAEDWAALVDELGQHGTHCRPYADTTKRNLEFIVKKWEQWVIVHRHTSVFARLQPNTDLLLRA